MTRKRKKKNSEDLWYHILFWIIVVVLFPISLSVWFYRTKRIGLNKVIKRRIIAIFWAVIALLLVIFTILVPALKKKPGTQESSTEAPVQSSSTEARSEAESSSEEVEEYSELTIKFLNMNQADAIVVCCDGRYMIVDSGEVSVELSARLLETDLITVDYLVAATPYNQSVGGFARAMTWFAVQKAYCSVTSYDSDKFRDFTAALKEQNITLQVPRDGETVDLGKAKVTFLGPVVKEDGETGSLVIMIEHKNRRILLCGAADSEELEALIQRGYDLNCDVIKIGNHGAQGALSYEVIEKTSPEYAVISAGADYGCPSEETLIYLKNHQIKTYRTDMQGDIDYKSTIDTLEIKASHDEDADTLYTDTNELTSSEENQGGEEVPPQPENPPEESTEPAPETEPAPQTEPQPETEPAPQTDPAQPPAPPAPPEEAVPDANGYTYAKKVTDNYFHRLNCPEIAGMTFPQLEKYNVSRAVIMDEWRTLTPCPVCNP